MVSVAADFVRSEAAGGMALVLAAATAMVVANAGFGPIYRDVFETEGVIRLGALEIAKPLRLWINDGLMAIFFFQVGLEIKREMLEGQLSSFQDAVLPGIAALGGMVVPVLFYVLINQGDPEALRGWAIPAATDIAFALGVLALVKTHAPLSLKVFLLALAIMDDIGAIAIIAVFFSHGLSLPALGLAGAAILVLLAMNRAGCMRVAPYILVGVAMWVFVLKSGVHATLAGVVLAMMIPLRDGDDRGPLSGLEHGLNPYVAYFILPLFAFANAGVTLEDLAPGDFLQPVTLGILAGLFFGKQLGVFGFTVLAYKLGVGKKPPGTTWTHIYGMSVLTGIGFTMSLFIGTLAFQDAGYRPDVRLGVLGASLLSALVGYLVLRFSTSPRGDGREASKG